MTPYPSKILLYLVGLGLGVALLPAPVHADWDSVPPLHLESIIRMHPLPEEEAEAVEESDAPPADFQETEAVEGERINYLAAEGGYYTRNFNYAPLSHGEYQAFLFGQVDRFGALIRLDYLNQFDSEAFGFELGGHYFVAENIRAGLAIRFAPTETLMERQGYTPFVEMGLWNRRIVAHLRYQFRDFSQANLHEGELELNIHLGRLFTISPLYRLSLVQPQGLPQQTDNGFRIKVIARPLSGLALHGRYGIVQQDFEAGAPTPFDSFRAQEYGGGLEAAFALGVSFYFDFDYQNRDNGESSQEYTIGTYVYF